MRTLVLNLALALPLTLAAECAASPLAGVRLGGGASFSTSENQVATGIDLNLGVSVPLTHPLAIRLDVAFDRLPWAGMVSSTPEQRLQHDDHEVLTVLAGLELVPGAERRAGPLVTAAAGVARLMEGDLHVEDINLGSWTEPGEKKTVAALALGAGLRFPMAGRAALRIQAQWIGLDHTTHELTHLVPLRVELEF